MAVRRVMSLGSERRQKEKAGREIEAWEVWEKEAASGKPANVSMVVTFQNTSTVQTI